MCDEKYDEDIIKFCTKDGTPLVDDAQPSFTALPSENLEDDFGEETIIRRKPEPTERIVIPTSSPAAEQQVRPRANPAAYSAPPPSNTAKTVVLTIIGTLFILGCGAGLFWFLQKEKPSNTNLNANLLANQNVNLNANAGFNGNFNFNANSNFNTNYNVNTNLNANVKTPTPTPKPSPSVTPSPTPSGSPSASPTPAKTPTANKPSPTPTPRTGPRPPLFSNRNGT